jgi:uncharacterized protein (DUF433 family)
VTDDFRDRIAHDPEIMTGKACIKGTRVPVYIIMSHIARGRSHKEIVEEFPYITLEDVQAAVDYAAWLSTGRAVELPESA